MGLFVSAKQVSEASPPAWGNSTLSWLWWYPGVHV